ncbi:MAG: hypothetical protein HYV20_01590 [Gemmatimonadetes bacterium]|nr:hypothetical protein [Gemmatimonadota bacterium]
MRIREPYVAGLDLGQAHDPTALVIVERSPAATAADPVCYRVRYLRRWALWTPYPKIVADVRDLLECPPLKGATAGLVVDATGVGAAVVDLFEDAGRGVWVVPVTITAGSEAHEGFEGWRVPKRDLVGILQVLLQNRRLRIAKALPEAGRLLEEMEQFRVQITERGRDTYAAAAGTHDDLVVALALVCWFGEMVVPARIEADDDKPFDTFSPEALQAEWERGHRVKRHFDKKGPPPETSDWMI